MKRRLHSVLIIIALCVVTVVFAAPGSESDPLITLSYLEGKLAQFSAQIDDKVADSVDTKLAAAVEDIKQQMPEPQTEAPEVVPQTEAPQVAPQTAAPQVFEVYTFKAGEIILFGDSTEFIVRRGSALVIDPLDNRIPDLTDGRDIAGNTVIPLNHHMLNPVKDGRGIQVLEGNDFWIMIKGPFEVEQ